MAESVLQEMSWNDAITVASPHPYVLAVTVDAAGKPNAIGLGWWTICSWSPPMIAISVGMPRYSRECLDHCREFVLCLLGEQHARGAWLCGSKSGRNIDRGRLHGGAVAQGAGSHDCRERRGVRVPRGERDGDR
jgi:flavin reductase (DIM6/NTAB) family NADH-FMN oxidoreductase RutF